MNGDFQLESVSGLSPASRICVGTGYSREEIKAQILSQGRGITREAVTTVEDLAWGILGRAQGVSRQPLIDVSVVEEVLRQWSRDPAVSSHVSELFQRAAERPWISRLARAILRGREAFAHTEELQVYFERLEMHRQGAPSLEWVFLLTYWELWLEQMQLWDRPRLLREATSVLLESSDRVPFEVLRVDVRDSQESLESRELAFWDAWKSRGDVRVSGALLSPLSSSPSPSCLDIHPTWDDAADAMADEISQGADLRTQGVVLSDVPHIRRSVMRALRRKKIPLFDSRDPTEIRSAEWIKWAWNRLFSRLHDQQWELRALGDEAQRLLRSDLGQEEAITWNQFWKSWTKQWNDDAHRVSALQVARRVAEWRELSWERLQRWKPTEARALQEGGLKVYRPNQIPWGQDKWERVWLMGLSSADWEGVQAGDAFLNDRVRSVLASEFHVTDRRKLRAERRQQWRRWWNDDTASEVRILDARTDWDGSERTGTAAALVDLGVEPHTTREHGTWPRRRHTDRLWIGAPSETVRLEGRHKAKRSVSEIDLYSRCAFLNLGRYRWKLEDARVPSVELPADAQGILLHSAAEKLIRRVFSGEEFDLEKVLNDVWREHSETIESWRASERVQASTIARWSRVFSKWIQKERSYAQLTQAKVLELEQDFEWKVPGTEGTAVTIKGILDRVDVHPETGALVVIDYKSGGTLPTGVEMADQGLRLQLGITGLAMQQRHGRPVAAAHYVLLNASAQRNRGIFFEPFVDKKWLTHPSTRKKNLFSEEDADRVWASISDHIQAHLRQLESGVYDARPKDENECERCRSRDLCGRTRRENQLVPPQRENGAFSNVSPDPQLGPAPAL